MIGKLLKHKYEDRYTPFLNRTSLALQERFRKETELENCISIEENILKYVRFQRSVKILAFSFSLYIRRLSRIIICTRMIFQAELTFLDISDLTSDKKTMDTRITDPLAKIKLDL